MTIRQRRAARVAVAVRRALVALEAAAALVALAAPRVLVALQAVAARVVLVVLRVLAALPAVLARQAVLAPLAVLVRAASRTQVPTQTPVAERSQRTLQQLLRHRL